MSINAKLCVWGTITRVSHMTDNSGVSALSG